MSTDTQKKEEAARSHDTCHQAQATAASRAANETSGRRQIRTKWAVRPKKMHNNLFFSAINMLGSCLSAFDDK